jgi:hypothetical protein
MQIRGKFPYLNNTHSTHNQNIRNLANLDLAFIAFKHESATSLTDNRKVRLEKRSRTTHAVD